MGVCEKCGDKMSTETHHIYHQSKADANGFITTPEGIVLHKNHPKNLMRVCKLCHDDFHLPPPILKCKLAIV